MERITSTEAARRFSDLMNRVKYRNESFVIVRNGEEVGRIVPASTRPRPTLRMLVEFLRSDKPKVDEGFLADLDAIQAEQSGPPESSWDS